MKGLALPLGLIILGTIWFLKSTALLPNTTTLLALLLAGSGVALLLIDGLNKSTIVASPMMLYAGLAVYLNDDLGFRTSPLIALGMVLLGILMVIARLVHRPSQAKSNPQHD